MEILIYGYGNPGRQDDGLGIRLSQRLEDWVSENQITGVEFDNNYQLNIEDAEMISRFDVVVFVDATLEPIQGIHWSCIDPSDSRIEFTMHAVSPAFVLDLCTKLFQTTPEAYLLQIKGAAWEFTEGLSSTGKENVHRAIRKLKHMVGYGTRKPSLSDI